MSSCWSAWSELIWLSKIQVLSVRNTLNRPGARAHLSSSGLSLAVTEKKLAKFKKIAFSSIYKRGGVGRLVNVYI